MVADSPGGTALAKDANYTRRAVRHAVAQLGGVGDFDADTLSKILAGKHVAVSPMISETGEGLNASASPKDLETMFQLAYLRITAPRKDDEQFKVWKANSAEQLDEPGALAGVPVLQAGPGGQVQEAARAARCPRRGTSRRSISTSRSRSTRTASATSTDFTS